MKRSRRPRARGRTTPNPAPRTDEADPAGTPITSASWLAMAAIAVIVAMLGVDVFHVGFFADDFHFLDVARRIPLLQALTGQFGIWPWYRPLSRELFFEAVVASGSARLVTAHLLGLACIAACAWQIRGLGLRLANARVAALAPVLFLIYGYTKFLVAWSSGFQDLLATLLVLLAVRAHVDERPALAAAWAFLAVFAKETAFLVFPIIAFHAVMFRRDVRRWLPLQALAFMGAAALHLAVRMTWHTGGTESQVERSMPALLGAVTEVAGGFIGRGPSLDPVAIARAIVAAAATAILLVPFLRASRSAGASPGGRSWWFLAGASLLGLTPLVVGHGVGLASAYAYYAFSAVPWLALLAARALARLPGNLWVAGAVALVGWNTLAFAYRAPDLSSDDGWRFENWNWNEAVRISAVSRRLAEGLRLNLAGRPESLVVLYSDIPRGCYFQTEDGPATRESLSDPTMRAFWINAPPFGLRPGTFEILSFDHAARQLRPYPFSTGERGGLTATAVAAGNGAAAWAFASGGDSIGNARFEFRYYRAAATLLAEGADAYLRELDAAGLSDTTGAGPGQWTDSVVGSDSPLRGPMITALRHPLDARAHVGLADAFGSLGAAVSEATELRIAAALDPRLHRERLRLARTLLAIGLEAPARRELELLIAAAPNTPEEAAARQLLGSIGPTGAEETTGPSIRDFLPR